jgi:hypothetical protein
LSGRKIESFGSLPRHDDEVSLRAFAKKEKKKKIILFIEGLLREF